MRNIYTNLRAASLLFLLLLPPCAELPWFISACLRTSGRACGYRSIVMTSESDPLDFHAVAMWHSSSGRFSSTIAMFSAVGCAPSFARYLIAYSSFTTCVKLAGKFAGLSCGLSGIVKCAGCTAQSSCAPPRSVGPSCWILLHAERHKAMILHIANGCGRTAIHRWVRTYRWRCRELATIALMLASASHQQAFSLQHAFPKIALLFPPISFIFHQLLQYKWL